MRNLHGYQRGRPSDIHSPAYLPSVTSAVRPPITGTCFHQGEIAMLHLVVGSKYRFTLVSGRTVVIVVHGQTSAGGPWEISVDSVRGTYTDINQALGEPFTQVAAIP